MNKRQLIIIVLGLTAMTAWAQTDYYWLRGRVHDNFTDAGIKGANVYLLNKDNITLDSTKIKGRDMFSFRVNRDKSFRSCIIKVVHPDYQTLYSTHSLKSVGKSAFFDLPTIFVKRKNSFTEQTLGEVVVTATKVKMFYRGDTLVYNADAFNVADGSMLDALIKQMPGTELKKNGEIFVNGKKIDNLLLNGKDFFRGNNKLMLENLPYYTVKEIKVYDQTTDKAMVLHDDKAKKDYVMDVNLKKEYSKGYMANVGVGAGTEDAYLTRLFGLRFTDVSRFAIVGGMNNLNMADYAFNGRASDDGEREGRTVSNLMTAELLTEHKRNKNVMTVELNRKKREWGTDEFQETFHNEGSTFGTSKSISVNRNLGASLSNKYTLKMPFWMESTTKLRFNSNKDDSDERYYESDTDTRQQGLAVLDSLFNMGVALNDPSMISARRRWVKNKSRTYGASQDFAFAKTLRSSDIIEISTGADYSKNTHDTDRFNHYLMWNQGLTQTDVAEAIDRPDNHVGARADVSYKISRLLYNTDLNFYAGYRFNRDKDRETITDAITSIDDAMNSYDKRMTENRYRVGIGYHYDHRNLNKKLRTEVYFNLPLSIIDRSTHYTRYSVDTCLAQSRMFIEPSLTISRNKWVGNILNNTEWDITAVTSLKYSLPEATQLITLPLTSDRINIYEGNAFLKSPMVWNTEVSWQYPIKQNHSHLMQHLKYIRYFNQIIQSYRYINGVYINKPYNVNGNWNLEFSTKGEHQIKVAKQGMSFGYTVTARYLRTKNYVAEGTTGVSRQISNDELHLYLPCALKFSVGSNVFARIYMAADWRKPMKSGTDVNQRDTWEYTGGCSLDATLPADIDLTTDCKLVKRQGYANDELNKLACEWDMSLSKSILKNRIDLKLQAIDILRQYKSVAYVINERGIRETHAVSLPSYLLFSVTYKFNKQPKKK